MTYLNIWTNFSKWVEEQTENKFVLNIYPLGIIRHIDDKSNYGINIKISDSLLNEFSLKWDESRFNCEKDISPRINMLKLNLLAIGANLNIPKIYIHNGLQNLFKACLFIISEHKVAVIDLGPLGNFYSKNHIVFHLPSKVKNQISSTGKISIKTLLEKPSTILEQKMKNQAHEEKKNILTQRKENLKESEITLNDFKIDQDRYYNKEQENKIFKGTFGNQSTQIRKLTSINKKDVCLPLPSDERHWKLKDMLDSTFNYKHTNRQALAPIFFNVYSNTRAAPFTGEKTQIPICHRIGSFYSLSLQNFVIDRTTKSIKILFDEYFLRNYSNNNEIPATEEEEYKFEIQEYHDSKKVDLRKHIYKMYKKAIEGFIKDEYIAEIKESWLVNIVKLCLRAYKLTNQRDYDNLLNQCIKEILVNYQISIKKSIIDYMLKHPEQREKLGVPISFRKIKEYAEAKISRPSDNNTGWKSNFSIAKIKISSNLMLMSDNITKILKYYIQHLKNTTFLTIPNNYQTMSLNGFIENQKSKVDEVKKIITEDWKKYVENVLKENKIYKDQLFIYFKSVAGVMSTELREIIITSLKKFHQFICKFKKNTYKSAEDIFDKQFKSKYGFEESFLEISIRNSFNGFYFSEDLNDIHAKIIQLVKDVIRCSKEVERPDNMFIKNLEKQAHLWEVPINDPEVTYMINDMEQVVKENIYVIDKVLHLYDDFKFVCSEREYIEQMKKENIEEDKNSGNLPKEKILSRENIEKSILKYKMMINVLVNGYPDTLHMNMIKIDCSEINDFLKKELTQCIEILLKYIFKENISIKSKVLLEEIEKLKEKLGAVAGNEQELAEFEKRYEEFKITIIPKLYDDYADFIEWVLFFWKYGNSNEDSQNPGGSDMIANVNNIVKDSYLCVSLIQNMVQQFIQTNLKDKRATFEAKLEKTRINMGKEITEVKKDWDETKNSASENINQDESYIKDLEMFKIRLENVSQKLEDMRAIENLLGSYNSDETRLETCKKELLPLIKLFQFVHDMNRSKGLIEKKYIHELNFEELTNISEKSAEVVELFRECNYIKKNKVFSITNDINFFKILVEIGKAIHTLIIIVKIIESIPSSSDDSHSIIEENKKYCIEFTKLVFKHEKGQDFLKNLILKQISTEEVLKNFNNSKGEVEKIVFEWEAVKNIYDSFITITSNIDVKFQTTNFENKFYFKLT